VPSSPPAQLPSIPDGRVRGEPEDSSDENLRQFEISENGQSATATENATVRIRLYIDNPQDSISPLESSLSYFNVSPLPFAKGHEPDGSSGFYSDLTRTGRLSNRNNDDNKLLSKLLFPLNGAGDRALQQRWIF